MTRLRLYVLSFILLLVAACGGGVPDIPESYSWCYEYDWVNETYSGFTYAPGSQTVNGLESSGGVLGASYTHSVIVAPIYVLADISVIMPDSSPRDVVASLNIFGVPLSIDEEISGSVNTFIESTPGAVTNTNSVAISASTESDSTIIIHWVQIYGNGTNPFLSNNCDGGNSTPTAAPTSTEETTEWCYKWDYSNLFSGWTIDYGVLDNSLFRGIKTVNTLQNADYQNSSHISIVSINATEITVTYAFNGYKTDHPNSQATIVLNSSVLSHTVVEGTSTSPGGYERNVSLSEPGQVHIFGSSGIRWDGTPFDDAGYDTWIIEIEMIGDGFNPFGADNCNTPPTATPAPIDPSLNWCFRFDSSNNFSGWEIVNGHISSGVYVGVETDYRLNEESFAQENAAEIRRPIANTTSVELVVGYDGWESDTSFQQHAIVLAENLLSQTVQSGSSSVQSIFNINDVFDGAGMLRIIVSSGRQFGGGAFDDGNKNTWIVSVKLRGIGTNPYGANNCNQPTPSPAPTQLPTSTPTAIATNTPQATSTIAPTFTPQNTVTQYPTSTPFPTPLITPTATPDPGEDNNLFDSDGTCTSLAGTEPAAETNGEWTEWLFGGVKNLVVCQILPSMNFIANTINNATSTLTSIYTALTTSISNSLDTLVYGIGNVTNFLYNNLKASLDASLQVANQMLSYMTGFVRDKLTELANIVGGLGNLITSITGLVSGLFGYLIGDWSRYVAGWLANFWAMIQYHLVRLVLGVFHLFASLYIFITNLLSTVHDFGTGLISFIISAFVFVGSIYALWNTTTPIKPPGLPECATDPTSYDICAVWYIAEFTFFSGIGEFIIPAFVVFISFMVLFFFLETVVERIQRLWKVFGD